MKENVNPSDYGLDVVKAKEMTNGLSTILGERVILTDAYKEVISMDITKENLSVFKGLRIRIRDNRTKGIESWHKANKSFYLAGGRFVDAIKNKEVIENNRMEKALLGAENHFLNLAKEELAKIQGERVLEISKYVSLDKVIDFSAMDEDVWEAYRDAKKKTYLKQIEIELQVERERQAILQAEKDEQNRIKKENDKLRAEAKEVERLAKIESDKRIKEDQEREEKAASELKERNRLAKIESDKLVKQQEKEKAKIAADLKQIKAVEDKRFAEFEAKLKKEREASELIKKQETEKRKKLEAELKVKKDAEIAAEKLRLSLELKAKEEADVLAKAPIKNQMKTWIDSFSLGKPTSENATTENIELKFEAFRKWASGEVDKI